MTLNEVFQQYKSSLLKWGSAMVVGVMLFYLLLVALDQLELSWLNLLGTFAFISSLLLLIFSLGIFGDYFILKKFERLKGSSYVLQGLLRSGIIEREGFSTISGLNRSLVGYYQGYNFHLALGYNRKRGLLWPIITLTPSLLVRVDRQTWVYTKAERQLIKDAKNTYGLSIGIGVDHINTWEGVNIRGDQRDEELLVVMHSLIEVAKKHKLPPYSALADRKHFFRKESSGN